MTTLTDHDLVTVLRRTPKHVFDLLKTHAGKVFVAGGFIRSVIAGEPPNDIDLFTGSKDYAKAVATGAASYYGKPLIETDNAYTIAVRPAAIQFIHRWTFDTPEFALASFDFSIAQAAVWWDSGLSAWKSCCSERFYADLASRRLVYLSPVRNEDAGGSLIRVLKFYQKGYRIPLDSLGAVISRLIGGVKVDLSDGTHKAFMTDEHFRGKVLTGLLREVDPNSNPDRYIAPRPDDDSQIDEGQAIQPTGG